MLDEESSSSGEQFSELFRTGWNCFSVEDAVSVHRKYVFELVRQVLA